MEFQKIVDTTSDDKDLPSFVTKNGLKFMINQKKNYNVHRQIRIKHQGQDQIYVILVMHTL